MLPRGSLIVRMEFIVRAGQKVRLKTASPLKQRLNLPPEAQGAVICSYRLLRGGKAAARRLDVRFSSELVLWGAPDDQFEAIDDEVDDVAA